jgi:hypothetical protein
MKSQYKYVELPCDYAHVLYEEDRHRWKNKNLCKLQA